MLATEFGWTWEYIDDEMTLQKLDAICKHWEQIPPLAVSVATLVRAFVGTTAKEGRKQEQDPQALAEMLGGVGFNMEKPEWLQNQTSQ